jgi:hypothetical protein
MPKVFAEFYTFGFFRDLFSSDMTLVVQCAALSYKTPRPPRSSVGPFSCSSSRLPPVIPYHYYRTLVQTSPVCTPLQLSVWDRMWRTCWWILWWKYSVDIYSSMAAVLVVSCRRGVLSQGVSRVSPYSHHHSHRWVGALLISTFKDTLQRQGWVVKQISFVAGVRSLNEQDLRDNLTKWKDLRDNLKIISKNFTVTKELTLCRSQGHYKTLTTRKQKEKR